MSVTLYQITRHITGQETHGLRCAQQQTSNKNYFPILCILFSTILNCILTICKQYEIPKYAHMPVCNILSELNWPDYGS
jgi:hypothetical protein